MRKLFTLAAVLFLLIYAFEAPLRYGLNAVGQDNAIFIRDGLIALPLVLLFILQCMRGNLHPAYWVFAAVIAVHGGISYLNFHTPVPAAYGTKFLLPVLFGFLISTTLTEPNRKLFALLALVWLVSVVALYLDKYILTYPWTGMRTTIGGIQVDISRDWDITSGDDKRVAGLMRSSINAAAFLPMLAFVVGLRCNFVVRVFILVATGGAVFLTTQKGALLAFAALAPIFCVPRRAWVPLLGTACLTFTAAMIAFPLLTIGLRMPTEGGVFSLASLAMRITDTWPAAWQWISNEEVFPFGTGLGGLSGAMRFFAENFYNPADNLFIFMYGNFGVLALFYLAWLNYLALAQRRDPSPGVSVSLAILAYNLGYGMVLAILEGPICALFIGASLGTLWHLREAAFGRRWAYLFALPSSRYQDGVASSRSVGAR